MIKVKSSVIEANCDACAKNLMDAKEPHNINYGKLVSSFGFGSRFDTLHGLSYEICESCWEKVCVLLKLRPTAT